jgi:hypothetical protein
MNIETMSDAKVAGTHGGIITRSATTINNPFATGLLIDG